jgi:hypothetical protein
MMITARCGRSRRALGSEGTSGSGPGGERDDQGGETGKPWVCHEGLLAPVLQKPRVEVNIAGW